MQITVFRNFSKEINSTKQPTGGEVVTCVLKVPTTRLNPTFILDMTDTTITHIKWNDRYYFVEDYNHMTNNITEYVCSIDAMGSWKSNIGASSQYVLRSASDSNEYIIDNMYPTTTNLGRTAFPFSGLIDRTTSGCYVVGVINGNVNTSHNAVSYYAMPGSDLGYLLDFMFNGDYLEGLDKDILNPAQYIVSCQYFPISVPTGQGLEEVKFGYWTARHNGTILLAYVINSNNRIQTLTGQATIDEHPGSSTRGKYLNAAPFRRIILSMYSFGQVPIDSMFLMSDQTIYANISIDLFTGTGTLVVYTTVGYELVRTQTQLGVPIQLSQIHNTTSLINRSINQVLANNYSGNIPLINKLASIADASAHRESTVSSVGSNGDITALTFAPAALVDYMDITADDNVRLGRPLCEHRTISSLSGYVQCSNADIEIPGTKTEREAITSFMNSGFYYE